MKENLHKEEKKRKYRTAPRLYREFTNSFTLPIRRIKRMALEKIRIFAREIKGGERK